MSLTVGVLPGEDAAGASEAVDKSGKDVILLGYHPEAEVFFRSIGRNRVSVARNPEEAIAAARRLLRR